MGRRFPYTIWESGQYFADSGLLSFEVFGHNSNRYDADFPRLRSKKKSTRASAAAPEPALDVTTTRPELPSFVVFSNQHYQTIVACPRLPAFLRLHKACTFVCYLVADQFWSVLSLLEYLGDADAVAIWWETCNGCRIRDACLLDQLIHLATIDAQPTPVPFCEVVSQYARLQVDARSQTHAHHQRFHEQLAQLASRDASAAALARRRQSVQDDSAKKNQHTNDDDDDDDDDDETKWCGRFLHPTEMRRQAKSYWDYALGYVSLTFFVYMKMCVQAVNLMEQYSAEMLPNALISFGPLSEGIQVKAEIAFAQMTRNGIHVDVDMAGQLRDELADEVQRAAAALQEILDEWRRELMSRPDFDPDDDVFDLFHLDRFGSVRVSKISGKPALIHKHLEALLLRAVDEVRQRSGEQITVPTVAADAGGGGGGGGGMSLSTKEWAKYAVKHPFIGAWIDMEQAAKLYSFMSELRQPVVHPKYALMVRNGRSSCYGPNIQQIPRKRGFRDVFVPSPGHVFVFIDYSFIELCTLAAVCESRYGRSMLANVIREGVDPHSFTAATLQSMALPDFLAMKDAADPQLRERFQTWRQRAKAINFGIPGGQGASALREYALTAYGVELTLDEARSFRAKMIEQIFPELNQYLHEDRRFMQVLSWRLGISQETCWQAFKNLTVEKSSAVAGAVRNVIRGYPYDAHGNAYPEPFVAGVWDVLVKINKNPDLDNLLALSKMHGNEDVEGKLFGTDVTTLTGRLRGGVSFTQACNTPFSGLAADGAKLAIWDLTQLGYRVVGFVHDEVLIEVADTADFDREAALLEAVMINAMADLTGSVPIMVKTTLATRWSREAVPIFDAQNRLVPWQLESDQ